MNNPNIIQKTLGRWIAYVKSMPQIGFRILKTAAAVFILLTIFKVSGLVRTPFYAVIATILCIQSDLTNSKTTAINRTFGTALGAIFGLLFTVMEVNFHLISPGTWIHMILVSLGVVVIIYVTVLLGKTSAAYISCVVFLSVSIVPRSNMDPMQFVFFRFIDTLSGIFLAYFINWLHLPRKKNKDILFVSELDHTLINQKGQLSPYSKRELNRLIEAGANITLSTSRTPAAIIEVAQYINLNLPVIAMGGAVLYDLREKRYLLKYIISPQTVTKIEEILNQGNFHCFENVIIDDVLLIYYQDFETREQKDYYESLRKSPFRNYIHGIRPEHHDVVYFTILDQTERLENLKKLMEEQDLDKSCRFILKESDYEGQSLFHILCKNARKENMNHYLQNMLKLDTVMTFGSDEDQYDVVVKNDDFDLVAKTIKKVYEPIGFNR